MALLVDLYGQYNRVNDWPALAKSVQGAYIKFSDGVGGAKTPADEYVARCRQSGIPFGGYHFAQPGDPTRQADIFVALCRKFGVQLAPALDLEADAIPAGARAGFARAFLQRVHSSYPVVALYASTSWLAALNPDAWGYPWLRVWGANYGINNGQRNTIRGYGGHLHLHQYTSTGRVAGVAGDVDLDWTDNLPALLHTNPATPPVEDDMAAIPYDYPPTGSKDAAGNIAERRHTFTLPVGTASSVVAQAWISFKSAFGPAKRVRLMAIGSGEPAQYFLDQTWTEVPADAARPHIEAPSGTDQFTAVVESEFPYSLGIETRAK